MVTKVPELGPAWKRQLEAQQGWSSFRLADFERLKDGFGVDWVLVEGFKDADLPKIEVWRAQSKQAVRYPDDAFIVAIATDSPEQLPQATPQPVLDLNDAAALVDWLTLHENRFDYQPENFA